ncbi:MAG: lipopolysaccharide biosynthesis protein [Planctomycetota bacterium]
MASEAKRAFWRISTSYVRLALTLVLGILLVPLLVGWVGLDAFGLLSLLGATVGFAAMIQELTEQSMIRELGAAFHDEDAEAFRRWYGSAFLVSAAATVLTAVLFAVLMLALPFLRIPPDWLGAARWMVAAQGGYGCLAVLLTPIYSMYVVQEQFGWFNFWTLARRATAIVSVLVLAFGVGLTDVAQSLTVYALLWSALLALVYLLAVLLVPLRDRRLWPDLRLADRTIAREILSSFSWNSAVIVSTILQYRLAALIMNLAYGVYGNAVLELGFRLAFYVRVAVTGATQGLEAVSARLSSAPRAEGVLLLLRHSTRLQGLIAIPGGLLVLVLAEPLLQLWVGRTVEDPERTIPAAANIVRIVAVAVTTGAIAHGWMLILYGAGHVRRYAPALTALGVLGTIAGAMLLLMPEPARFYGPVMGYAVLSVIAYFFVLPRIGARCLATGVASFYRPLARPAIASALAAPVLAGGLLVTGERGAAWLAAVVSIFGLTYAVLAWLIVVAPDERRRILGAALQRRTAGGEAGSSPPP